MVVDLNLYQSLLKSLAGDERITVWHIATILAIVQLAIQNNSSAPILVSRKKIMRIAHINSFMTYHKCIKELQEFGYIEYNPSYHPAFGSEVYFLRM